jgi:hypothetical protein
MARGTDSAIQRLQVGLIGLLVVLLFVSLASMLSDKVSGPAKTAAAAETTPGSTQKAGDDPVVDMGVTPVVPDQPDKLPAKASAPAQQQ